MHITKNVCKSLLGTLLNMPEKTKDGTKEINDLVILKLREELQGGPPKEPLEEMQGKGKKAKNDDNKGKKG